MPDERQRGAIKDLRAGEVNAGMIQYDYSAGSTKCAKRAKDGKQNRWRKF